MGEEPWASTTVAEGLLGVREGMGKEVGLWEADIDSLEEVVVAWGCRVHVGVAGKRGAGQEPEEEGMDQQGDAWGVGS